MRIRRSSFTVPVIALAATLALAGAASAAIYSSYVNLSAAQEVPPSGTNGTGTAFVQVDDVANTYSVHLEWQNLSSAQTVQHIHGFASPGTNAGVLQALPNGTPSNFVWTFTESQQANILAGLTYLNVHTSNFPGGEIRGQVVLSPKTAPVPSLSQWGMIVLSMLLFGAGAAYVLRRRRAIA